MDFNWPSSQVRWHRIATRELKRLPEQNRNWAQIFLFRVQSFFLGELLQHFLHSNYMQFTIALKYDRRYLASNWFLVCDMHMLCWVSIIYCNKRICLTCTVKLEISKWCFFTSLKATVSPFSIRWLKLQNPVSTLWGTNWSTRSRSLNVLVTSWLDWCPHITSFAILFPAPGYNASYTGHGIWAVVVFKNRAPMDNEVALYCYPISRLLWPEQSTFLN